MPQLAEAEAALHDGDADDDAEEEDDDDHHGKKKKRKHKQGQASGVELSFEFRASPVQLRHYAPRLVAGIHVFTVSQTSKQWMAGPSPAMTAFIAATRCL